MGTLGLNKGYVRPTWGTIPTSNFRRYKRSYIRTTTILGNLSGGLLCGLELHDLATWNPIGYN